MKIGELAARAGVNVQTILFYERRRLLPQPPRTPAGYRAYTDADLAQVHFIRQTRLLGFTLREIAALLPVHGSPADFRRPDTRTAEDKRALFQIVSGRLAQVDAQIAALQRIRAALRAALDRDQARLKVCPAAEYADGPRPKSTRRRAKSA